VTGLPPELAHMPICPHRGLPIPYIAEVGDDGAGHFTILDPRRQRECYEHRLCAMCGLPMGEEVALIGDVVSLEPGGFYIEPPVHEDCGKLAIGGLCPYISRERVPRRAHEDDGTIAVLGTLDDLATVGRGVAKRPVVMAVVHRYKMAMHMGGTNPMPVFVTSRPIRVHRYAWADNRAVLVAVTEAAPPQPAAPVAETAARASIGPAGARRQPVRQTRSQRRGRHGH
jgi:hypothetical protein